MCVEVFGDDGIRWVVVMDGHCLYQSADVFQVARAAGVH